MVVVYVTVVVVIAVYTAVPVIVAVTQRRRLWKCWWRVYR